jgi:hypothetical protein
MGAKNAVVIPNPLGYNQKIAELENKKVIAVAEIHLKRSTFTTLAKVSEKHQIGFRNLWKDTTSLR